MATLFDVNKVKYTCSCKRLKSMCYLYFCKHCVTLKCKECVLHEIDPKYYCAYCLENKTSKEASQSKYRCSNCFNCPSCQHTLIVRGSSVNVQQQRPQAASTPSVKPADAPASPAPLQSQVKFYYLVCGFCRWSTRDIGLSDVSVVPGGWKFQENENSKRINELIEEYKSLALKERNEKDKKKYSYSKRKVYQTSAANEMLSMFTPIHKLLQSANVNSFITNPIAHQHQQQQQPEADQKPLQPSIPVDNFDDDLPDDYYKTRINASSITSISQRLANPEFQVDQCTDLYPLNKFFVTKESKRCNACDHNVIKPENNITSIKFKLHQMALFMVPEVRIVTVPEWKLNEPNRVILSLTNKCESEVNVTLLSNEVDENARIIFLNETVTIDRQDTKSPTAGLKPGDNPDFVCYRKDNKIAVFCDIIPLRGDVDVQCSFEMKHSYYGMSSDLQSAPVMQILSQQVNVNFGPFTPIKTIQKPKYVDECLNSANQLVLNRI